MCTTSGERRLISNRSQKECAESIGQSFILEDRQIPPPKKGLGFG